MNDYFLIGEIKSVYNDDGYVVVISFSDFIDRFFELDFVYAEIFGVVKKFFVEAVDLVDNSVLIKFVNFDSFEFASYLVGLKIFVDEKNVIKLDESTFFIHDLIGCDTFFNEKYCGKIVDIYSLKSNDVYVILDPENEEKLIPGNKDYIGNIDIVNKRIELTSDLSDMFYDED